MSDTKQVGLQGTNEGISEKYIEWASNKQIKNIEKFYTES